MSLSNDLTTECRCGHMRYQHSDPAIRDDGHPEEYCGVKSCECEDFESWSAFRYMLRHRFSVASMVREQKERAR